MTFSISQGFNLFQVFNQPTSGVTVLDLVLTSAPTLSIAFYTLMGSVTITYSSARGRSRFPAAAAAFLMQAKGKNARVYEISAHVKDPQVVKINPEPSTTAHLIACVASAR